VVPSHFQMMLAEQALYMARNREHRLKGLLGEFDGAYDWVLQRQNLRPGQAARSYAWCSPPSTGLQRTEPTSGRSIG